MSKYRAILTTAGAAKIAAASAGGKPLTIDRLAVGDGDGTLPTPSPAQTTLINECYRAALNSLTVDNAAPDRLIAELIIPANVGGFWLREMGLYDADGVLIAVGNMAESYKPKLEEGSGRTQTLRMVLIVSHTEAVTLIVSGDMVTATRDFVAAAIDDHAKSRNHPDATTAAKGFVQLSSATNSASETLAATPKAVKAAYDLAASKLSRVPDATTGAKGIVQLSSATDSVSETLAATPKAVKVVNDAAVKLAQNLADLPDKAKARVSLGLKAAALREVGSADGQLMEVGAFGLGATCAVVSDPNEIGRSGFFGLTTGKHKNSPNLNASWEVLSICYDGGSRKQIFMQAGASTTKTHVRYRSSPGGVWGPFESYYSTENKPTAAEVGALTDAQAVQKYALRSIKVNGKPLSGDVNLVAGDINAYTKTESDGRYVKQSGDNINWLTVKGAALFQSAEFIRKTGMNSYSNAEGEHHQTNGLLLHGSGDLVAEIYHHELVGNYHNLCIHVGNSNQHGWYELRGNGELRVNGTWPTLHLGETIHHPDGNISGELWGGYLRDYINNTANDRVDWNSFNNRTHVAGDRNAWWYKDELTGFIIQGGVVNRVDYANWVGFPRGYARQCFGVQLTLISSTGNWFGDSRVNIQARDMDNNGFNAMMDGQEQVAFWQSVGV